MSSTGNVSVALLDGLRRHLAAAVAEGADAHQVEVDACGALPLSLLYSSQQRGTSW